MRVRRVFLSMDFKVLIAVGINGVHVDPTAVDSWVCDLCENEENLDASVVSHQL